MTNKISPRLLAIAEKLNKDMNIADIGSDHGDLPIYLSDIGFTRIYASDNKKGPYSHLVNNIKKANKEDLIETKLTDGLKDLPDDIDTALILGMGGYTIDHIIRSDIDIAKKMKLLIVSPQSEQYELRNFLTKNNFEIVDEFYVEEHKKFYPVIFTKHVKDEVIKPYDLASLMYGPKAIEKRDPILLKYLTNEFERYQTLPLIIQKKQENSIKIKLIEELLTNWYK